MDLSKLKGKLKTLQEGNKGNSEKKDFSLTTFKPPIGKVQLRILPWNKKITKEDFFEVLFYYEVGNKQMISPLTWGEKDPINIFVEMLKKKDYSKENYFLMKQLEPKVRVFLPVIVRGEESKGVRFWQFGKLIYEELVKLALDEETTGFENVVNGRDFTVETVSKEHTGTGYNKTTIRPRLKTSPLSDDPKLVEKWLNEQPNPLDEYEYCKYSFEQMKEALNKYLTPSDEEEEDEDEDVDVTPKNEAVVTKKKKEYQKPKAGDAFDDIFEGKEEGSEIEDDDLPF